MIALACGNKWVGLVLSGAMIKFLHLDILDVSHRIPWKNKNAVYRLQIIYIGYKDI